MQQALANLRVYDASMGVAGPYCTSMLARFGAEVIKIEPPEGDWGRHIGQAFEGQGAYFLTYNRGKKSVVLDLRLPADQERARALVASCDVVVESFRPGVMGKWGLDYPAVSQLRPDVVYLSISGFGQQGPGRHDAALDTVMQAFSGWMHLNRDSRGTPVQMNHISIDALTGLYAFQALSMALMERRNTGRGAYLDVSLMHSAMAFLAPRIAEHLLSDGHMQDAVTPPTGVWRVADGSIAISVKNQAHFNAMCQALGRGDIAVDPRFASRDLRFENRVALSGALEQDFAALTVKDALGLLQGARLAAARVNDLNDLLDQPQVRATGLIANRPQPGLGEVPVLAIPGFAGEADVGPAPFLGEHTVAVFAALAGRRAFATGSAV